MLNRVQLIGHLGRDIEVRQTQSGEKIGALSLATTETYKQEGERRERTEWHRLAIFGNKFVEALEPIAKKGRLVYVEGRLQTRRWTDEQGVEHFSTEVAVGFDGVFRVLDRQQQAERAEEQPERRQRTAT